MAQHTQSSFPPLTSPTSEDDRLSWLRLIRSYRVGVVTFFRLMREHGTAQAALAALPDIAGAAGVRNYRPYSIGAAQAEMSAAKAAGVKLVCYGGTHYPPQLGEIPDPPPLLWCRGDLNLLSSPMVALVGARNASSLGTRMAKKLAQGLVDQGYVVVSGLARGVDTAAHMAALDGGTIAVFGGGVDVIYPAENSDLAAKIAKTGLLISEQPMGLVPQSRHFPRRNRLISGLAQAVVIVEAAARSGSLITAKNALDQGREVLAVPGHPFDARAAGCNMLIRDGAGLIRSAKDVQDALPPRAVPAQGTLGALVTQSDPGHAAKPAPDNPPENPALAPLIPKNRNLQETAALHRQILARLGPSPMAEDQLIRDLSLPTPDVTPELVTLELEGKIKRAAGGLLSLS